MNFRAFASSISQIPFCDLKFTRLKFQNIFLRFFDFVELEIKKSCKFFGYFSFFWIRLFDTLVEKRFLVFLFGFSFLRFFFPLTYFRLFSWRVLNRARQIFENFSVATQAKLFGFISFEPTFHVKNLFSNSNF